MEVYDELERALKEIERLKIIEEKYKDSQLYIYIYDFKEEIERLNKIIEIKNNRIQQLMKRTRSARIDKAREYIEKHIAIFKNGDMLIDMNIDELLEILDGDSNVS